MKKWICFMMTIILCAMTLTACGNSDRQQESVSVQEQEAAEDTEQIPEAEEQEDVEELEAEVQQETEAEDSKQQETSGSAEEQAGKVLVVYYTSNFSPPSFSKMLERINLTFVPSNLAFFLATFRAFALTSTPRTSAPLSRLAVMAITPEPVPMSNTLSPSEMCFKA